VAEFQVKSKSPAVGRTLRDLRIRETTGATVVAVVRNGNEYFSPHADYMLREGDVLLVVSPEDGINKFESMLT
jgi:K+/H+ antiporter YhaU regulatory subunit KhtT